MTALFLEVFRLNGELLGAGNELAKPYGLTAARWQVMGAIELSGQALTVSQIARRMGLARQGVQRIVNELNKSGFVHAIDNVNHKRAPLIAITESGKQVMAEINSKQAEWVNNLALDHSESRIESSRQILLDIRDRI